MSVNLSKYYEIFGSPDEKWDKIRQHFSPQEFALVLRNEKLRSERSGLIFTYLKIHHNHNILLHEKQIEKKYSKFIDFIVNIINLDDSIYDIKYVIRDGKIGVLLLNTHPYKAKELVESIIVQGEKSLTPNEYKGFIYWLKEIELTAFPFSKVVNQCKIKAQPVILNDFKWYTGGTLMSSRIFDTTKLVFDWKYESFKENTSTLNNDIVKDSSPTARKWQYKYLKRFFDFIGAVFFITSLIFPMLIIGLIVKLTSRGPILFKQKRIGQFGKPFQFLKFRSMFVDSDTKSHEEYVKKLIHGKISEINQGSEENPVFKMLDDPRITPFGKIMRRTSLDEIPQFFNVLKGDMSIIGPRPPIPYEVEEYKDWHLRRISDVKPGITGLWQVYGRNSTTFDDMVRYDIEYVENWSLFRDMKIIFLTVRSVLAFSGY